VIDRMKRADSGRLREVLTPVVRHVHLCLSEIKLAYTDDDVRREMA